MNPNNLNYNIPVWIFHLKPCDGSVQANNRTAISFCLMSTSGRVICPVLPLPTLLHSGGVPLAEVTP